MFCRYCGKEIPEDSRFCKNCGSTLDNSSPVQCEQPGIMCPKCNSSNVTIQLNQENRGAKTITKTTVKVRKSRHGCLWWLFIGWWWWMIDLMIWLIAFAPRLIYEITKKRKIAFAKSKSFTKNNIQYKKHYVCQNCGYTW